MKTEMRYIYSECKTGLEKVLLRFYFIIFPVYCDLHHIYLQGHFLSLICLTKSSWKYFSPLCNGSAAPGAWAQNVLPGPKYFALKLKRSRYSILPVPLSIEDSIFSTQGRPSRHGVHQPQLSSAKNFSTLWINATGQVLSSRTIIVPVPSLLPAAATVEKSIFTSRCSSIRKSVDAPPGNAPLNLFPSAIPPACFSSSSLIVIPRGSSHVPGFRTLPLTPKSLVPPVGVRLNPLNQSAPFSTICEIHESVSTLFTTVGLPNRPLIAGNGGFVLGRALLPSSELSKAVSSPQIYLPALECTYKSRSKPDPRMFLPRYPALYASSMALRRTFSAFLYAQRRNIYALPACMAYAVIIIPSIS